MPLGHPPEALWAAIGEAERAGEPDEILDDARIRLHKLEDLAANEAMWAGGPEGWSRSVQGVWSPPQKPSPRPKLDGWRPGLAENLLRVMTDVPVASVPLPAKSWIRDMLPAMHGAANADQDVYWKTTFRKMNDAANLQATRVAAQNEGKDWAWTERGWQFKNKVPPGGLAEDDPHIDVKMRQRALDADAMRAVADVARKAAQLADIKRLEDVNTMVEADGTVPPVGISGWNTKVIDSPPHVFDALGRRDPQKAWSLTNKVKEAAMDYFPGGPFSRRRVGVEGLLRSSDIHNGNELHGQLGRQGTLPLDDPLAPPAPDPLPQPKLSSAPLEPSMTALAVGAIECMLRLSCQTRVEKMKRWLGTHSRTVNGKQTIVRSSWSTDVFSIAPEFL